MRTPEYEKFQDDAVRQRAFETGIARFRSALFVGMIGPLSILVTYSLEIATSKPVRVAMVATAPLAILLLVINYLRLPGAGKSSKEAIKIIFLTLAAVVATAFLAAKLALLK